MGRKMLSVIFLLFLIMPLSAGTPVIDGTFDGEGVWGTAQATADGVVGWSSVNVNQLYVTYDNDYAYFAATFHSEGYPAGWMRVAFDINVKADGGWNCPWGAAVSYAYTPDDEKPDYVLVARLQDDWAELRDWTGSEWGSGGVNVKENGDIAWADDFSYVEGRVSLDTLGYAEVCDVQFYVSGNNDIEHGVFDACPDDEVMTSWNDPTELDNYAIDVPIGEASALGDPFVSVPEGFHLAQNYPNPFNPSTVIRYQLPEASQVELTVFDMLGKKVATLVNGKQNSGPHQVAFSAAGLANGVYFYQLKAGSFEQMRKMVLMK